MEEEVIQLIYDVQFMCVSGGLCLYKFVFNNKNVINFVVEFERVGDIKDFDFLNE